MHKKVVFYLSTIIIVLAILAVGIPGALIMSKKQLL